MLAILVNTHLWCAVAGALAVKLMSTTAMWAGWGEAAKVGQAAAAAASIVKTALTHTYTPLPTTVAEMKAAAMTAPVLPNTVSPPPPPTHGIVSKIEHLFHANSATSTAAMAVPAPLLAAIEKMLTGIEGKIVAILEAEIAAHAPPAPVAPVAAPVVVATPAAVEAKI